MGSDDLFKKRREGRKQRKHDFKLPKINSFLIVTEGEKTEPLYFNGIKQEIEEKIGGNVDVVEVPTIDVKGQGSSTKKLIEITEELEKEGKILYQNVWVVFDKDDFEDFDEAIKLGKSKGYNVAWTNPSFEYWLYLHFYYSDASLDRKEWNKKLSKVFGENNLGDGKYRKNYKDLYSLVDSYDGVNTAIKNAKRIMSDYIEGRDLPSRFDPGTSVHELMEKLKKYLDD